YCHHHSKGTQGDKKAMDRASGSGVFARDPDALLDMIELEVDDQRRKTVTERRVCDRLAALLDEEVGNWRDFIPQDDQLRLQPMFEAAKSAVSENAANAVVERATAEMLHATAWRFDGILREFPPIRPVNAWFVWPIHIVDDSGILDDVMTDGQTKPKKGQRISKKERLDTDVAAVALALDTVATDGQAPVEDVARAVGGDSTFVYTIARRSRAFTIRDGIIRRKDEN
ncbi:MAG: hypothetical protein IJS15_01440, partial [Victivallales bacterium]|nr:hypothetical protein [Victivallales bacterium]